MGIVDRETLIAVPVMLHAVAVLEFRAVIHGDGLERAVWELPDDFMQGGNSGGTGFSLCAEDYFKPCFTFGQCEYGLLLSPGLANDAIKLPMTERLSMGYVLRAAVYRQTFRGANSLDSAFSALLAVWLFR